MVNVGVIGLGTMGTTHLDVYARRDDVRVVAVADKREDRLQGKSRAAGNIEGQAAGGADLSAATKYGEGMELIADSSVQLVDICLPTPLHRAYAEAALDAGKHVLVEKPVARTAVDGFALADHASRAKGVAMPAMCMRFWPGWDWLKEAVNDGRYGRVLAASFRRLASHPGGPFYSDGAAAGGAILDLHIHDTDFVHHLFGVPEAVVSRGYARDTSATDHVTTQYVYPGGPIVTAEGGWSMSPGFGFVMQYTVNFERATAIFDLAASPSPLRLVTEGKSEPVSLRPGMGYEFEIDYLLRCIREGVAPDRVTLHDAAVSVAIVEAEQRSIETGHAAAVELPATAAGR